MKKINGLTTIANVFISTVSAIYLDVLFTFSNFKNNIYLKALI